MIQIKDPYALSNITINGQRLGDTDSWDFDSAYAPTGHTHDDRYYTESESDNRFAALVHSHDDRYYTESEANSLFAPYSHSHSYLPLSGGVLTGDLDIASGNVINFAVSSGSTAITLSGKNTLNLNSFGYPQFGSTSWNIAYLNAATEVRCAPSLRLENSIIITAGYTFRVLTETGTGGTQLTFDYNALTAQYQNGEHPGCSCGHPSFRWQNVYSVNVQTYPEQDQLDRINLTASGGTASGQMDVNEVIAILCEEINTLRQRIATLEGS